MIGAYLRVSTDEQRDRHTIETQRQAINGYCKTRNPLTKTYADDGVSGTVALEKRPQGRALLADAKAGLLEELIVWKWDRLGRNLSQFLQVIENLKGHGVKVTCVTQPTSDDSSGRLLRSILGAFAEHERDQIIERSVAGSRRLAKEGVWLGGIVPYGYRKAGEDRQSSLVLATESIPGHEKMSEVDVIRRIFRMASQGKSCQVISDHLNSIGVPPAYTRDGRAVLRGKRKQLTAGRWRPSRVRNLIINKTYMGVHEWGKRRVVRDQGGKHLKANPPAQWIIRKCPAIVDGELWAQANAALHQNQITAMAHSRHNYLLRGLIKCGLCGLNFVGAATTRPSGKTEFYYRCNGRCGARGLYGAKGQRCPSQSVRGADLEAAVMADIEEFLLRPGVLVRQLQNQMLAADGRGHRVKDDIQELEAALARNAEAKDIALRQVIRKRIGEEQYDGVLNELNQEATAIEKRLTGLRKISADTKTQADSLRKVESVIENLRSQAIAGSLTWKGSWQDLQLEDLRAHLATFEKRRRIVEALVERITGGQPKIAIRYRFDDDFKRFQEWARGSDSSGLALDDTDTRIANRLTIEKVIVFPTRKAGPVGIGDRRKRQAS